ncbi:MAG: cysteine desulfurase family protein [Phycisphaerae bacterium]
MSAVIYLDNNATTRVDPRVVDAMLPYLTEQYGNPSSLHHFGAQVAASVEECRATVAAAIGARDSEITFTSGGTESDNAALLGVLEARPAKRHIVISAVEHHAILEPAESLERRGVAVTRVGVDHDGRLDLDQLAAAIRPNTALVSIMLANNETGVVFSLREIADIVHARGSLLHTDAVNALGKLAIRVDDLGCDLMSLSAHKIHGPKGTGALYIRRGTQFRPQLLGGPQERQRRGGTQNVAGVVAFATACRLAIDDFDSHVAHVRRLRDDLETRLRSQFPTVHVAGDAGARLPNTCCACFPGVEAEALLLLLSQAGIAASSGAACSSGSLEPSHVLKAMGIDPVIAQGQIRFSLSRESRTEDIERLMEVLPDAVARVAAINA